MPGRNAAKSKEGETEVGLLVLLVELKDLFYGFELVVVVVDRLL